MKKTKKEQNWQNVPKRGAKTIKQAVIIADKPEHIKEKEEQEKKKEKDDKEQLGIKPFVAAYNGRNARRINKGGIIRLKRRNEKQ